jgi:hypothetical protein
MKYHFRNMIVISMISTLILFHSSCDKDEATPAPDNHINVLGTKFQITHATLTYLGEADLIYNDNQEILTHYAYSFVFADAPITLINGPTADGATCLFSFAVYTTIAGHSPEFEGGTFNALDPQDFFGAASPTDEDFFTVFFIRFDDSEDNSFNPQAFADGSQGQIIISGRGDKYKVTFKNGTTDRSPNTAITGSYDGTFQVVK